jgi:hypothetical protein
MGPLSLSDRLQLETAVHILRRLNHHPAADAVHQVIMDAELPKSAQESLGLIKGVEKDDH